MIFKYVYIYICVCVYVHVLTHSFLNSQWDPSRDQFSNLNMLKNDPEDSISTDYAMPSTEIATHQGLQLSPSRNRWTNSPAVLPPQTLWIPLIRIHIPPISLSNPGSTTVFILGSPPNQKNTKPALHLLPSLVNVLKKFVSNSKCPVLFFKLFGFKEIFRMIIISCALLCSVVSDSLQPQGLQPTGLLWLWDSPGKNTGVGCRFLLQGIFPSLESPESLALQVDSLPLSLLGSPVISLIIS